MSTVKIVQPGRVGDIIICLPIAKHYHDAGHKVFWPVYKEYANLFDSIDYVEKVVIESDSIFNADVPAYEACPDADVVVDILIGWPNCTKQNQIDYDNSPLVFDRWKYEKAGVPIEKKFTLEFNRNIEKENKLKELLNLPEKYNISHSVGSSIKFNLSSIKPKNDYPTYEFQLIDGFSLFDWYGVLSEAQHLYLINSSVFNLVNGANIGVGNRTFIPIWTMAGVPKLKAVLGEGWEEYSP